MKGLFRPAFVSAVLASLSSISLAVDYGRTSGKFRCFAFWRSDLRDPDLDAAGSEWRAATTALYIQQPEPEWSCRRGLESSAGHSIERCPRTTAKTARFRNSPDEE